MFVPGQKFQVLPTVFGSVCSHKATVHKFSQPGRHLLFGRYVQRKEKGSKDFRASVVQAKVVRFYDQTIEQDFGFRR